MKRREHQNGAVGGRCRSLVPCASTQELRLRRRASTCHRTPKHAKRSATYFIAASVATAESRWRDHPSSDGLSKRHEVPSAGDWRSHHHHAEHHKQRQRKIPRGTCRAPDRTARRARSAHDINAGRRFAIRSPTNMPLNVCFRAGIAKPSDYKQPSRSAASNIDIAQRRPMTKGSRITQIMHSRKISA